MRNIRTFRLFRFLLGAVFTASLIAPPLSQAQSNVQSFTQSSASTTTTTIQLASGEVGSTYSATLASPSDVSQPTWLLKAGALPDGITLSSSGVVSGIPTAAGNFSATALIHSHLTAHLATLNMTVRQNSFTLGSLALANAQIGQSYSAQLTATGGKPSYRWSLRSGSSLPTGLTLSTTGLISGTPTVVGASSFRVQVMDSSVPNKTLSGSASLTVNASTLSIGSTALAHGQVGTAYNATFAASGGTPGYTWSIASGQLPAGLTLSTSGTISGTPASAGSSTFTVQVSDSGSPVQTKTVSTSLKIVAAPSSSASGTTWYVRPDGGTRYVASQIASDGYTEQGAPSGQCDGKSDAAYPGSGVNQHCAFKDIRFLWSDGAYANISVYPTWGWVVRGGDTIILRGSIADGVSYRVGWNNPSSGYDSTQQMWFGFNGDPYDSSMPSIPSGTAAQPTRILGGNYASCSAQNARTRINGGYAVNLALNMAGSSYVDVECLDITDFSNCAQTGSATSKCDRNIGTLSDASGTGITWTNTSTHDTVNNVRIHGMSGVGMAGPTGDGVVMTNLDIIGNPGAGWNADNGTVGVGKTTVTHFSISWNGCAEEYPIVDALPYFQCADDNSQGYGDGFGTATMSSTGWQMVFDQGVVNYNTQDGLDALHLVGPGSSMTITRVLAYGNMGQQIKNGGSAGTVDNNVIITNCNALRFPIPGTPAGYNANLSDFCRAADAGVLLTVSNGSMTKFRNNTIYSASATAIEVGCNDAVCDGTANIDYRNNIFVGFLNNPADGYTSPGYTGSGNYSNPIYDGTGIWPFGSPGSFFSNNITYHPKSNWTCPNTAERNALCNIDPKLADETWHVYGYNNVEPTSTSPALGAGTYVSDLLIDFTGATRGNPPTIGAYEH